MLHTSFILVIGLLHHEMVDRQLFADADCESICRLLVCTWCCHFIV